MLHYAGNPARLQGDLAVSRAIGDLPYRQYGLTSDPELRWHNISAADVWLVLASDGIFESLSVEAVCHIAARTQAGKTRPIHLRVDQSLDDEDISAIPDTCTMMSCISSVCYSRFVYSLPIPSTASCNVATNTAVMTQYRSAAMQVILFQPQAAPLFP